MFNCLQIVSEQPLIESTAVKQTLKLPAELKLNVGLGSVEVLNLLEKTHEKVVADDDELFVNVAVLQFMLYEKFAVKPLQFVDATAIDLQVVSIQPLTVSFITKQTVYTPGEL